MAEGLRTLIRELEKRTDLHVFVLSPLDLIISKIARYSGPDATDIAEIISRFQIRASEIEQRAEEALAGYVGNSSYLRMNLRDVLATAARLSITPSAHSA